MIIQRISQNVQKKKAFPFEKYILDGFEVQDCIPEVHTLIETPILCYNIHFGCNGNYGYFSHNHHLCYNFLYSLIKKYLDSLVTSH